MVEIYCRMCGLVIPAGKDLSAFYCSAACKQFAYRNQLLTELSRVSDRGKYLIEERTEKAKRRAALKSLRHSFREEPNRRGNVSRQNVTLKNPAQNRRKKVHHAK